MNAHCLCCYLGVSNPQATNNKVLSTEKFCDADELEAIDFRSRSKLENMDLILFGSAHTVQSTSSDDVRTVVCLLPCCLRVCV